MEPSSPPIRRFEHAVEGTVAASLFRRGWVPREPRAAVLIVHGYGEHSGRYEHVGARLAGHGFATHAYDHLGHGRSSGPRCHVRRMDDYLDDLERMLTRVREEQAGLPTFVLGHSMGGLVTAMLARERRPEVAGYVTSGAALETPRLPRLRERAVRLLRRVAPRLSLPSDLDPEGLCTDPRVVEAYLADPLVHRRMTTSLAVALLDAMRRTAPGGGDVAAPLLALHGGDDPICLPTGSERFAAAAPQGRFLRYPGLRHEILNEPVWRDVLGDVTAWLDERLARPEATTA